MSLVMRETGTGLVLAEQSADEASLGRALKQIDPRFVLQKHPSEVEGGWVYKVFCVIADDQPAVAICTWCDPYGRPLPLSSGLLELVKSLRPDAPNRGPDADERNRQIVERTQRDEAAASEAIIGEHAARVTRGQVVVGMSTRPRKRYWQRDNGRRR